MRPAIAAAMARTNTITPSTMLLVIAALEEAMTNAEMNSQTPTAALSQLAKRARAPPDMRTSATAAMTMPKMTSFQTGSAPP